jgi:hypothetical protein
VGLEDADDLREDFAAALAVARSAGPRASGEARPAGEARGHSGEARAAGEETKGEGPRSPPSSG